MNNFKDYGFEANFEGEILKEVNNFFIGYIITNGNITPCKWKLNGEILVFDFRYNLKKTKPKWYEIKDNVGKILLCKKFNRLVTFQATLYENIRVEYMSNYYLLKIDELELLTEDTIKDYLVKE